MSKKNKKVIIGKIKKHARGFAFLQPEEQDAREIFIAKSNVNGAMNNDLVSLDLIPEYLWEKSPEGIVTKVLERAVTEVVGTLEKSKQFGFVVSEDKEIKDDIFIKKENFNGARNGDKVVAKIIKYPSKSSKAEGAITEIVASYNDASAQIKGLIRSKGLKEEFPQKVLDEAKKVELEASDHISSKGRRDLRNLKTVTIDGPTAKDLDDAISIEINDNKNYVLYVHIADVSNYVIEGSKLDKEAAKRGNSVYLINRVLPMLPKELSNGICSLNPKEDRLTMTCQMEIDKEGQLISHKIYESIINSDARMVYDDVSDIIENENSWLISKYESLHQEFLWMNELALILRANRKQAGSLDFNFPEASITLDEEEEPVSVEIEPRRIANRIIEEFMLMANKTVAEQYFWLNCPFVYRVHEKPDREEIVQLKQFLKGFSISLKGNADNIYPKALNDVMMSVEGKSYENIVNTVILRSMKKAFYSTECMGHFGLAFKYYTHFTSPIRRYPDLMIHRIIKKSIHGEIDDKGIKRLEKATQNAAVVSSQTELKAQELERDVKKIKKAQYMMRFVGEEFSGVISGVTDYGIYVELANTIEGMVRVDSIKGDYYSLDASRYRLIGQKTNKIYTIGQEVRIKVIGAKPIERQIDFILVE